MTLDVIVPVYDAVGALRRCLCALDRALAAETRVLLIDDASPDPAVRPLLEDFVARHPTRARLLVNARNLGFVGTVNRGFAATAGDVVLLNSDALLTTPALGRLRACLAADPRIATATPFSNHAEICSFPEFCRRNPEPEDPEQIAQAMLAAGPPAYPELPTAVGFCMAIRRHALARLGDFDQATFGRGYGEENDFCQRAAGHGWRNVLCDDAYVVHLGGASFAPLGLTPGGENLARLSARYPHYTSTVADFIRRDPLAARRAAILRQLRRAP